VSTLSDLARLCSRLGYQFSNTELLKQALTHRSASIVNNERLEFLGDAVLDLVVGEELYLRFPEATEGELTRLRSLLVNGKTLAKLAEELEIGSCLVLGPGELKTGGNHRESILADALEAILGAVFLESGLDACRHRTRAWLASRLDKITLDVDERDSKTRLQEWLQGRGLPLPVYEVIATEGEPHDQILTISCTLAKIDNPFVAKASSRKKAEKKAAQLALAYLLDSDQL
jgi:ribonuclease III